MSSIESQGAGVGEFKPEMPSPVERRHVRITLTVDMDLFWKKREEAYARDKAAVSTDFNRGTPWIIESTGEQGTQRHQPPNDRLDVLNYVLSLLPRDEASNSRSEIAAQQKEIRDEEARRARVVREDKPQSAEGSSGISGLLSKLPEVLPAGSCFALLTQAGLAAYCPDLIMAELIRSLVFTSMDDRIFVRPTYPSDFRAMAVGFSYLPSKSKSGEHEFTFRAEGKGYEVPGHEGDILLGFSTATVRFDADHQLLPGQKVEVEINLPIPADRPYQPLVDGISDVRFYHSPAFETLGDFSVSVAVDGKVLMQSAEIKKTDLSYALFSDSLTATLSATKKLDALLARYTVTDTQKLNVSEFTEAFISLLKRSSLEERTRLQKEFFDRTQQEGNSLYHGQSSINTEMLRNVLLGTTSMSAIEDLVTKAMSSSTESVAHDQRMEFKKLFLELYTNASLEGQFMLQWQYRSLLKNPSSALYELMTRDVSALSVYKVEAVPVAHTAIEIDRFFDEVAAAREEKRKRAEQRTPSPQPQERLQDVSRLVETPRLMEEGLGKAGAEGALLKRKKGVVPANLISPPLEAEPLVPALPSMPSSPIAKRTAVNIAKKMSLVTLCSGLVLAGAFLGGVIGVAAALAACLVIATISAYVQQKRQEAREIVIPPARQARVLGQPQAASGRVGTSPLPGAESGAEGVGEMKP
jgi:hypothetical protein